MIGASTFATSYHAFWNSHTPTCEHFVRRLNLEGLRRFARPVSAHENSKRRALIAEYAFSLFVALQVGSRMGEPEKQRSDLELDAWRAAKMRLAPYVNQGVDLDGAFNTEERVEVEAILASLTTFFAQSKAPLSLRPVFAGCGYVDASEGDAVQGNTIYEIKTVERPFRSTDVRQVITYAALNFKSRQYHVNKIGLLNPRSGKFCKFDFEFVCAEISGTSAQELFMTIIDAISSGEISR